MATAAATALPGEFRSLEEDFVDCKMAINNNINELLHTEGARGRILLLARASVTHGWDRSQGVGHGLAAGAGAGRRGPALRTSSHG